MYAMICPDCGSYLDPGERCDCRENYDAEVESANKRGENMTILIEENDGQMRFAV